MSKYLFPIFIITPIVELQLLIMVHDAVGFGNTLLLVIITGVFGVKLAKREGFVLLRNIQNKLNSGVMPTEELLDGVIILVGGVLLITPGVLTDIFGLSCLIPLIRKTYANVLKRLFKNKVTLYSTNSAQKPNRGQKVDVDWNKID